MICYQCGCNLSEHDFCTNCGADVALYKKIIYISNRFYNEGLERANVRDLTGAITSLRQSLKFNKNNVEARNLLGLVYFETGEVVAALSEWVISKNLRPKKNIADDYIDMIQTNQNRLDVINQTIKKYNQALTYCNQDSLDLAVIQLKEVDEMLMPEEGVKQPPRKKQKSDEVVKYQSGNETIIQPANVRENKGVTSLLNLGIGVIIGIAIAVFLILPARIQASRADIDEELRKVGEQSDAKTATIDELQLEVSELTKTNNNLQQDLEAYLGTDGQLRSVDSLMKAADAYLTNPEEITVVADYLEEIAPDENSEDSTENSESFQSLYNTLLALVGPDVAQAYYDAGYEAYRQENYEDAIPNLEQAFKYDASNGDALYNLAHSYYRTGEEEKAKAAYLQVIELFPGTEKASKSEAFVEEIDSGATGED